MTTPQSATAKRGLTYSHYVLLMLFLAQVLSVIDRAILSILVEPIKRELELSDSAVGLLTGFAFVTLYAVVGFPIARWSDRGVRRSILSVGVFLWSLATLCCGLATNFVQLAAARAAVGIGEAAGTPPSLSLIPDYFKPADRPLAISIFRASSFFAYVIGMPVTGWIASEYGWRAAFLVIGLFGLPLALLIRLTVKEPQRGALDPPVEGGPAPSPPLAEALRTMFANKVFTLLLVGSTLLGISGAALAGWAPALMMRLHGYTAAQVGTALGPLLGLAGFLGTLGGGVLASAILRRGHSYWTVIVVMQVLSLIAAPLQALFVLHPNAGVALAGCASSAFLSALQFGPLMTLKLELMPASIRALVAAVILVGATLIPGGVAPLLVGWISDVLHDSLGVTSLRYGMIVAPAALLIGTAVTSLSLFYLPKGKARPETRA